MRKTIMNIEDNEKLSEHQKVTRALSIPGIKNVIGADVYKNIMRHYRVNYDSKQVFNVLKAQVFSNDKINND